MDKLGNTIDFYLSATRNTKAAKRFLGKALRGLKEWEQPEVLNTDKAPAYAAAIAELKAEGKCPKDTRHRQVKYLNNVIEADHGKLKLLIRPVRGFKTLKTAYATIKGFEVMRALRKGQAGMFALQGGIVGEARIVERAFALWGPCALTSRRWRCYRTVWPTHASSPLCTGRLQAAGISMVHGSGGIVSLRAEQNSAT